MPGHFSLFLFTENWGYFSSSLKVQGCTCVKDPKAQSQRSCVFLWPVWEAETRQRTAARSWSVTLCSAEQPRACKRTPGRAPFPWGRKDGSCSAQMTRRPSGAAIAGGQVYVGAAEWPRVESHASFPCHSAAKKSEHLCLFPLLHKDPRGIGGHEAFRGRISSCEASRDANPSTSVLSSTLPTSACAHTTVLAWSPNLRPEPTGPPLGFLTRLRRDPGNSVSLGLSFCFCPTEGQAGCCGHPAWHSQ